MKTIKPEILLYGTKDSHEDLLTMNPAVFWDAILWAKYQGFTSFRIVDYTNVQIEKPDFVGAISKKK